MSHTTGQPDNDPVVNVDDRPTQGAAGTADTRGSSAPMEVKRDDDTARDSFIGTDRGRRSANVSWGSIFAGVFIFLAVMVVFGLVSTALGLSDVGAGAVGIWSVIFILLALAAAGYVAGALAVRGGLLHGLVTWATSLVALLLLVGWVGSSILGTVGGALGSVAQSAASNISTEEAGAAAEDVAENVDPQQVEQATEDAQETVNQATDDIAAGAWWGVAGLVLGAVVAGFAGVAGARSAHSRDTEVHSGAERRRD